MTTNGSASRSIRRTLPALALLAAALVGGRASAQDPADMVNCVSLSQVDRTEVIDDTTILFYMRGNEIYRNVLPHRCPGLRRDEAFMYRVTTSQLCNVDVITVLSTTALPDVTCTPVEQVENDEPATVPLPVKWTPKRAFEICAPVIMADVADALTTMPYQTVLLVPLAARKTAGELAETFDITKGSLSHHFNVLKAADLVRCERRGQQQVYSLNTTVFEDVAAMLLDLFRVAEPSQRRGRR